MSNILNISSWTAGTGSCTGFIINGTTDENVRYLATDPWGQSAIVWEAVTAGDYGSNGGWNTELFNIDLTKMYRFSVWFNRTVTGNGYFYLGCNAYDSSASEIPIIYRDTGATATNPYFWYSSVSPYTVQGEWWLVVGHVWPNGSGTGDRHVNSGIYKTDGTKVGNIVRDFVWPDLTAKTRHRSYLFYATDTSTRQRFIYPRVDLIDGAEPTLTQMWRNGTYLTNFKIGNKFLNLKFKDMISN